MGVGGERILQNGELRLLEGRGPEDIRAAKAMEIVLDYQMEAMQCGLLLTAFCNDVLKYGFGALKTVFSRTTRTVQRAKPVPLVSWMPLLGTRPSMAQAEVVDYEGPMAYNQDPFCFFPDPRAPEGRLQEGEFVAFRCERGFNYLKKQEQAGHYFNIGYLREQDAFDWLVLPRSERDSLLNVSRTFGENTTSFSSDGQLRPFYVIDELWIELIPQDYGLSDSDRPEIWRISICGNVIIGCTPSTRRDGKLPCIVGEYEYDGYSLFNPGLFEGVAGLDKLLQWLFNSHINNVQRSLHNRFIFDPSAVVTKDLTSPQPGQLIRLREAAWGRDIRSVIQQLPVVDITRNNVAEDDTVLCYRVREKPFVGFFPFLPRRDQRAHG